MIQNLSKNKLDYIYFYYKNLEKDHLLDFLYSQLFTTEYDRKITSQERGNITNLVIALRFRQGWWREPEAQRFLPQWVKDRTIALPKDCRVIDVSNGKMFIEKLTEDNCLWILLPNTKAGPDIRYNVFCCYIKTPYTASSNSSMNVDTSACKDEIYTMDPKNWYRSDPSIYPIAQKGIEGKRFLHVRFELPRMAPSLKTDLIKSDDILCVDLDSDLAKVFFRQDFIDKYAKFVDRS